MTAPEGGLPGWRRGEIEAIVPAANPTGKRDKINQGRIHVNRILTLLAAGVCAAALGSAAQAQVMTTTPTAKATSLTRIECGTPQPPVAVNQRFSDTYAYGDKKVQFVYSCYLIKH